MLNSLEGGLIKSVRIDSLNPADSPRLDGVNLEHVRALMEVDAALPPIVVHRPTMRVIDGMHRLRAAQLKGDNVIDVNFVDGSEESAFVLAVEANVTHGLPLSLRDRRAAAHRIILAYPHWSNRSIAERTGLSANSIAAARTRSSTTHPQPKARVGRDGKVRPLNIAEGRQRAYELIADRPEATLREVANAARISVSTAHDVRSRIQRGDDPIPVTAKNTGGMKNSAQPRGHSKQSAHSEVTDPAAILQSLMKDPSLRFSETGRNLLRWLAYHMVEQRDIGDLASQIPPHCVVAIANLARGCGEIWLEFATQMEKRNQSTA